MLIHLGRIAFGESLTGRRKTWAVRRGRDPFLNKLMRFLHIRDLRLSPATGTLAQLGKYVRLKLV